MANEFLNDLGASLQLFNQGIQQYSMQRAIAGANDQIQQIRDSALAEDEKQQQMRNLAQDMTLRFMQAGATDSQVQQFQSAFGSGKPQMVQTPEQAVLMGTPEQQKLGMGLIKQKQEFTKEENRAKIDAQLEGLGIKATNAEKKQVSDVVQKFQKVGKAELEGLDTLSAMPDDITNNLEYTMALKQLIKRTDPRISNEDFALAVPNTDLRKRAQRAWDALVENKPLPQDTEAVKAMTSIIKSKTEQRLEEKLQGYADAQHGANRFNATSKDQLKSMVYLQWMPNKMTGGQKIQGDIGQPGNAPQGARQVADQPGSSQNVPSMNVGPSKYFR